MLMAFATGRASLHGSDNRGSTRSLRLKLFAGFFILTLGLLTFFLWDLSLDNVLDKTSTWLGRPLPGANGAPLARPPPPSPPIQQSVAQDESAEMVAPPSSGIPPDPLELPGWREGTKWVTNTPEVQMHHWLQRIVDGDTKGDDLDWIRNKTVLLLGDSVLREWLFTLCDEFVDGRKTQLTFNEAKGVEEKNEGFECVIPSTGTTFVNGFLYGMTNYSKYPADGQLLNNNFPVGPWLMEDRIQQFLSQYMRNYAFDMVVLNSGAWDMLTMYRHDVLEGERHDEISRAELDELATRLRECMHIVEETWPAAKRAFLQMQPFRANDTLTRWIWAQTLAHSGSPDWGVDLGAIVTPTQSLADIAAKLPPLFTRRRVSQLATTYRRVVREAGWDSLDFWKIAEASEPGEFYPMDDPVHPTASSIFVVMDFVLEKLWRWETYKV